MSAHNSVVMLDEAWAAWRTTYGFVDDVADAIKTVALTDLGVGETFNVGEAGAPTHRVWAARFAEALGWQGEVVENVIFPRKSGRGYAARRS